MKTLTLLALALLMATCLAAATPANANSSMANSVAITDANSDVGALNVICNQAIDNPVTAISLQAAGNEKKSDTKQTMIAATTATNANAKAANGAPRKVAIKTAALGAGTALTKTMAPVIMKV
ncbi:MAG: hypothetical protein WC794_03925 [Candidatus Doudnabacteria bacterium]